MHYLQLYACRWTHAPWCCFTWSSCAPEMKYLPALTSQLALTSIASQFAIQPGPSVPCVAGQHELQIWSEGAISAFEACQGMLTIHAAKALQRSWLLC